MTTTMRIFDNDIGVIWERETNGIISLKVVLFVFDVLNCREYDPNDFHHLVRAAATTAGQLDRISENESGSVGLTMTIQNRKYDRYETYRFEFERG